MTYLVLRIELILELGDLPFFSGREIVGIMAAHFRLQIPRLILLLQLLSTDTRIRYHVTSQGLAEKGMVEEANMIRNVFLVLWPELYMLCELISAIS